MKAPAWFLAAGLSVVLSASALAQAPAAKPNPQELMDEARVLQTTLEAIQAQVLQNESLAGKADALVRDVEARMAELEPLTPSRLAQLEQFRSAAEAAAGGGDRTTYDGIMGQARALQGALQTTRRLVLAEEPFMLRTVALQRELVDAMTVVEPNVPGMLRRLAEVARTLGAG